MTNKEVIEKIAEHIYLIEKRAGTEIDCNPKWATYSETMKTIYREQAQSIIEFLVSLGYVQPKVSPDLEEAITELAQSVCLELTGSNEGNEVGQREFIEELIKQWLSANRLVQLAEDQILPENPHSMIGYNKVYGDAQRDMTTPKDGCVWARIRREK